ncbi:B3 domain-containing protein At1g16640 [Daucus carota subsp. sativus]
MQVTSCRSRSAALKLRPILPSIYFSFFDHHSLGHVSTFKSKMDANNTFCKKIEFIICCLYLYMASRKLKKIPEFFKPFVAEDRERRLLIRPFFSEIMKDRLPNNAFIRDRKENFWPVEVLQREKKKFFEAGWTKFVQDKNVQYGDFLVFEYDGGSFFDVRIFGVTACEKEFSVEGFEADEMEEEEDEKGENYVDEEGHDKEMEDEEDEHKADNRVEMDDDELALLEN